MLPSKSELDLEAIFDALEEPVLIIDREYRLAAANAAARAKYGWVEDDRVHYCYQVTHGGDHPCVEAGLECPVRTVFATGNPARVVHAHTAADGSPSIEEVVASPLLGADGELRFVVEEIRNLSHHAEAVISRLSRELKKLRGILPMCASCKRIRDGDGRWIAVDAYISANSETDFTHGLCPACVTALYPGHHGSSR